MKHMLLGTVATVALLAASSAGIAQGAPDSKKEAPAASSPNAPEGKAPAPQAPKAEQSEQRSEQKVDSKDRAERASEDKAKKQESKRPTRERTAEPANQDTKQGGKSDRKAAETSSEPKKEQPKAAQQPEKAAPKAAESRESDGRKQGQKQSQDTAKAPAQQAKQVQATEQQRTGVRDRLLKQGRVERTKLNITLTVGATIPRSHRLHPLPAAIVSFAPVYRGYSYIVTDEVICIVDPATYVIVDVIPASSQRASGPERRQLGLTEAEMRFVYTHVPKDRKADVHVRLALGAEVPRSEELLHFPPDVIARLPQLEPYRFVVANTDVVLVDPRDNAVVLVIAE